MLKSLALLLTLSSSTEAFARPTCLHKLSAVERRPTTTTSTTELNFGIPSFLTPKSDDDESESKSSTKTEEKKMDMKGLIQLITAGAGAPFLGDYQGVDEETGNFMFSLEANNLVDEKGNSKQTSMPFFVEGWVDPEDEKRAAEGFKFPWQK